MARRRSNGEGTMFKRERTRKDGSKYIVWTAEVSVGYAPDGTRPRKTLYGKTQKELREKMVRIKAPLLEGTYSTTKTTVGQYLTQWLDYQKLRLKPRSHQCYADYIRLYIAPQLSSYELPKLTPLHIQHMMKTVAESVSADAANKARGVLKSALAQAVKLQLIARNPVDAVDKLKHEPKDITVWSAGEVYHFLEVAKSHRLYAAFFLTMSTGLRHGEVLGVRWQDIEGDVLTVRQSVVKVKGAQFIISIPKTRKGIRRVVLDEDTLAVLAAHRARQDKEREYLGESWENCGHVFTNELGGVIIPRNFDRIWYDLLKKSGLPRIRFHDLRHLHVSLLINHGLDPRSVADRIGHADPSFTLRQYSHAFEGRRRVAAVPMTKLLEAHKEEENDA